MALPETVYITFVGLIDQAGQGRLMNGLANASQQGAKAIHMVFQSTGGLIPDGVSLYNYFRAFPLDLHLYNTGAVQSVAVHAFLGAKNRYVSQFGTFMIHKSYFHAQTGASPQKLRALADTLIAEDARTEAILKAGTTIPADLWALHATQDVHFNAVDAVKFGIATAQREWQVPAGNQLFNL